LVCFSPRIVSLFSFVSIERSASAKPVFDVTICECEAASAGGLVFIWANHFEKRLPGLQRLD
jgi:hypothetical protein